MYYSLVASDVTDQMTNDLFSYYCFVKFNHFLSILYTWSLLKLVHLCVHLNNKEINRKTVD